MIRRFIYRIMWKCAEWLDQRVLAQPEALDWIDSVPDLTYDAEREAKALERIKREVRARTWQADRMPQTDAEIEAAAEALIAETRRAA